jgi:hypothetical protein
MAHCHGAEARYQKTICEAIPNELHLKGIAEQFCRQCDACSGLAINPCFIPCDSTW